MDMKIRTKVFFRDVMKNCSSKFYRQCDVKCGHPGVPWKFDTVKCRKYNCRKIRDLDKEAHREFFRK